MSFKKKEELTTCLTNFLELEHKLKDFQTVVYKTGESINTIQKFTINPTGQGLGLGNDKPRFLKRALAEMPKLYSAE